MGKVHVIQGEIALEYLALNPGWHRIVDAKFERPRPCGWRVKGTNLSRLVENDPNNAYMDLREATEGYKVVSKRKGFCVVDSAGNMGYHGWHEGIEGVFRSENVGERHIQRNPTVAEKALIAFRDGGEIYIFSEGGNNLIIKSPFGDEVALYGAPFDEVHGFDVIIPVYNVCFKPTDSPYYFETPALSNKGISQIGAAKLVLGKKGNKWVLNNVFGEQFAESKDKEKLLHIVIATSDQLGDGLEFYTIEPAKEPASK
jgi:hypothetical protein